MTVRGSKCFICFTMLAMGILSACHSSKKIYLSECDSSIPFKKVTYSHLLDSLDYYDKRYIEVEGKYEEGREESALFNDSLYVHKPEDALWVNFSQDCPLYLAGTHTGFFQVDDGGYTHISNKKIRIRGKLDLNNRGAHKLYKGCIDHVSFIEL